MKSEIFLVKSHQILIFLLTFKRGSIKNEYTALVKKILITNAEKVRTRRFRQI